MLKSPPHHLSTTPPELHTTMTARIRLPLLAALAAAIALAAAFLPGLWPSPALTPPPADASHSLTALGVTITSTPANGANYLTGESITARVEFNHRITSHNNGALAINIGGTDRSATPTGFSCGTTITYSYTVVAADADTDGIVIASNALSGTYNSHLLTSQCPGTPIEHSAAAPTIADSANCCETAQANHLVNAPFNDYDTDNDGLIEITTLAQLVALQGDPDGNGDPQDSTFYAGSEITRYNTAFSNRQIAATGRNGCSPGGTPGNCGGYELLNDLTFDTNGDGQITSADTYQSIRPFGLQSGRRWTTTLDGNGHTISYARPSAPQSDWGLFARLNSGGHITNLGVDNIAVTTSLADNQQGALVSFLAGGATVSNSWVSGTVTDNRAGSTSKIGGMVGELVGGTIRNSYANVAVSINTNNNQNAMAGGLVGYMVSGRIEGSYATGAVSGGADSGNARAGLGGLVGVQTGGVIAASYATGAVSDDDNVIAGGLVGLQTGGSITASYATGAVTTGASGFAAGLVPSPTSSLTAGGVTASSSGAITNSYWDTTTSGIAAAAANNRGAGHSTAALQSPTNYTGIYAGWNVNVNGRAGADDPWHFGTSAQYPILQYGRSLESLYTARGATLPANDVDYDSDDDNLIEISNLAQLNAVRYDLDGSGDDDLTGSHHTYYHLAFPGALPGMGCAAGPGMCEGYELAADLDFAGTHYTLTGGGHGAPVSGVGIGWVPIGSPYADNASNADYAGDFKGNGHTISNLYVNVIATNAEPRLEHAGLFRVFSNGTGDSVIDGLGLLDVDINITKTGDTGDRIILAGALASGCTCYLYNSYATGRVAYNASGAAARGEIGGLLGGANPGSTLAGLWSGVDVISNSTSTTSTWSDSVGGITGVMNDAALVASYATGHVAAPGGRSYLGGLSGWTQTGSTVTASYAAGTYHLGDNPMGVTVTNVAHPLGIQFAATNSYYNSDTYGTVASTSGAPQTTAALQSPTQYGSSTPAPGSIYAAWNVDVDNADGNDDPTDGEDDPWEFGSASQYPILKFGYDAAAQTLQSADHARGPRIDYDADADGLLEITTLAQLDFIRYNLDSADWVPGRYAQLAAAFPNAGGALGCPAAGCTGYELAANLDFAGSQWAAAPGWTPLGVAPDGTATPYAGTFEGNHHTISNLFIDLTTSTDAGGSFVGLFGDVTGAVRNVGLIAPNITNTRTGGGSARIGALAGRLNSGSLANSYVRGGTVSANQNAAAAFQANYVGCLLGFNVAPVTDSWASCAVSGANTDANTGMNVGGLTGGGYNLTGSYATGAVSGSGAGILNLGGLIGIVFANGNITSSYATGAVTSTGTAAAGNAGGLVGSLNSGTIKAGFATGAVSVADNPDAGGLVGNARLDANDVIEAAYATGSVARTGATATGSDVGGLIGELNATVASTTPVRSTYAIGAVSNANGDAGGLVAQVTGSANTTPVIDSYWNIASQTNSYGCGTTNCSGQSVSNLQTPTAYGTQSTDIYMNWNLDLDDDSTNDNPWHFGTASQYPILTYGLGPYAVSVQRNTAGTTDYDADDDNLIDIGSAGNLAGLHSLNAVRHDLAGAGAAGLTGPAAVAYLAGFPGLAPNMGCPGVCQGYELTADLDFDDNADGSVGAGDAYANWTPIGNNANPFTSTFHGRGHTISNLTIAPAASQFLSGLFARLGGGARVEQVGLLNANLDINNTGGNWILAGPLAAVSGQAVIRSSYATGQLAAAVTGGGSAVIEVGGLVGGLRVGSADHPTQLVASWADVAVTTTSNGGSSSPDLAGGLVGGVTTSSTGAPAAIIASYATGAVAAARSAGSNDRCRVGGLVGSLAASSITASYSLGAPSCNAGTGTARVGGLIGRALENAVITDTYFNNANTLTGIGMRHSSVANPTGQSPTAFRITPATPYLTGTIYQDWNVNLDGDTSTGTPTVGGDDPWDFGTSTQYPILKYGCNALCQNMQRHTEYDSDQDGLLEISTPAQLDAVRHDLNGNGDAVINLATRAAYQTAFPNHARCLTATPCTGYELAADIDLAAYPNWVPIGTYTATFQGHSRTINNLTITASDSNDVGLFSQLGANSVVESVGLVDVNIADNASSIGTNDFFRMGALAGYSDGGTVRYSYATGTLAPTVNGATPATEQMLIQAGGLIGSFTGGALSASWANVAVTASSTSTFASSEDIVGGLIGFLNDAPTAAVFAKGNVTANRNRASVGGLIGRISTTSGGSTTLFAAYSTGQPTATGGGANAIAGGLIGSTTGTGTVTINPSYWDTDTSNIADDGNVAAPEGRTTMQLQSPLEYGATGLYITWNVNVDGDATTGDASGNDDPWHFGTGSQYPTLVFNHDIGSIRLQRGETATTDYDADDDNLIDIGAAGNAAGLHQLNALRLDPDGSGEDGITGRDAATYLSAFPGLAANMGCPTATGCTGYELTANLDFDSDASGTVDTSDLFDGNWTPLPDYNATFQGNGHTIRNLRIRSNVNNAGLFAILGTNAVITSVGLAAVDIEGSAQVGALAGTLRGRAAAVWSSGTVTGNQEVGGLAGRIGITAGEGAVTASYSRATVSADAASITSVGGLVGDLYGELNYSYSIGPVSATGASSTPGGLVGRLAGGTVQASYWDITSSGLASADSNTIAGVTGQTIDDLQAPTAYGAAANNDLYAAWNVDVDNADANNDLTNGVDDPWDFGTTREYPVLKFGFTADAITAQRPIDYDRDNDDLIEITTPAQLNAIRWDRNGDGVQDNAANRADYQAAFPNAIEQMGCTSSTTPGVCGGYELTADLDLAGYGNFEPLGALSAPAGQTVTFQGNGHIIDNLQMTSASTFNVGLFGSIQNTATVESVGLTNVNIAVSRTNPSVWTYSVGALAGAISGGTVRYSYATGAVTATATGAGEMLQTRAGGLVGLLSGNGVLAASWADVAVTIDSTSTNSSADAAGGLVGEVASSAAIIASYAKGNVTANRSTPALGGLAGRVDSQANPGISASYSTGAPTVTGAATPTFRGGLIGSTGTANVTASYWDTATSGVSAADSPAITGVTGQTTMALQEPTEYGTQSTDIYMNWNVNVDGTGGNDNPWHFGGTTDYPILVFNHNAGSISRQMGVAPTTDYDLDDDGLIDVDSLAKLNAIRYDRDGDGAATGANIPNYLSGFAGPLSGMGCPTETGCTGYELTANLDFDTDGSGTVDTDDRFGGNWTPIPFYAGEFQGRGHTIANLTITDTAGVSRESNLHFQVGLFGRLQGGSLVEGLGLTRVNINTTRATATGENYRIGPLAGRTEGTVRSSYASGTLTVTIPAVGTPRNLVHAGGLVGSLSGRVEASWADVDVTVNTAVTRSDLKDSVGGLVGLFGGGRIIASYAWGNIRSDRTDTGVGGLVGLMPGSRSAQIIASYAIGQAVATGTGVATAGGVVGFVYSVQTPPRDITSDTYWDTQTSGVSSAVANDNSMGQSTNDLQGTLGYTAGSIYANWNVDVDDDGEADAPWDFLANDKYPILRFGHSPASIATQIALQDTGLRTVAGTNVDRIRQTAATAYTLEIQPLITSVELTLTPNNADAVAEVTGTVYLDAEPDPRWVSGNTIPLTAAGAEHPITVRALVTAPNGVNTREYTLTIQRIFCPKAEVNPPTGVVGEGGSADFTFLVCGTNNEGPVIVSWAVDEAASSANANDIGRPFTGTITVPQGTDQTATLSFPITDDNEPEPSETLTVIITAVTGGTDRIERRPATATIALSDPSLNLRAPEGTGAGGANAGQDTPLNAQSMLVLMEGAGNTYTMRMKDNPRESITVVIHSNHASITTTPDRVTFTANNYQTPQRITINAAPDGDDKNERATLTHILTDDEGGLIEIIDQIPLFVADTDPPEDDDIC